MLRLRYDPSGMGSKGGLTPAQGATALQDLRAMPGVSAIPIYIGADTSGWNPDSGTPPPLGFQPPLEYLSCADAAAVPALGSCAPGQAIATIAGDELFIDNPLMLHLPVIGYGNVDRITGDSTTATVPAGLDLSKLDVTTLMVASSNPATLERARTYLDVHAPVLIGMGSPDQWSTNAAGPMTFGEVASVREEQYRAAQQMIMFVVGLTLFVAGCGIAVATAGSLVERKRPFTLLRLSGTPLGVLRRVVFLESALPLVSVSVLAGPGRVRDGDDRCAFAGQGRLDDLPVGYVLRRGVRRDRRRARGDPGLDDVAQPDDPLGVRALRISGGFE